jgi:putative nucleotidyltransferase with HDIG domain
MPFAKLIRRAFWTGKVLLLAGTVAAALSFGGPEEWRPSLLVAGVLILTLVGQWLSVEIRGGQLSASMVAIVMAMGLLGPVPASVCGAAAMILTCATRRLPPAQWLRNLATFAAVPFVGGVLVRALAGDAYGVQRHDFSRSLTLGLIVFAVFLLATALSFVLFALDRTVMEQRSFVRELRDLVPLLPGEIATGTLATGLTLAYTSVGPPLLVTAVVVLLVFRQLTVALLRSEDRAEQLAARSRQLVGLQLGVLRTLVRALDMRDETTARHAAAVAHYAKALAAEAGCESDEQEMIHTAGLLHDIGKFTWPDRVLHAGVIEQDRELIERHPNDGAMLVGALDGYGAVAEAILHHHERVDGRGYPGRLIGAEIPIGSRIIAICSGYDTMTSGEGYRSEAAMTAGEAEAELRNAARNGQFDSDLVETFIGLLEREGPTFAKDAGFEDELEFGRRVQAMAEPR